MNTFLSNKYVTTYEVKNKEAENGKQFIQRTQNI